MYPTLVLSRNVNFYSSSSPTTHTHPVPVGQALGAAIFAIGSQSVRLADSANPDTSPPPAAAGWSLVGTLRSFYETATWQYRQFVWVYLPNTLLTTGFTWPRPPSGTYTVAWFTGAVKFAGGSVRAAGGGGSTTLAEPVNEAGYYTSLILSPPLSYVPAYTPSGYSVSPGNGVAASGDGYAVYPYYHSAGGVVTGRDGITNPGTWNVATPSAPSTFVGGVLLRSAGLSLKVKVAGKTYPVIEGYIQGSPGPKKIIRGAVKQAGAVVPLI